MATASGGVCCAGAGGSPTRSTAALLAAVLATTLLLHGVDAESCHLCGPAAEQVHRSRRPPPCRAPLDPAQVIACEPSHPYCATVATTPPYTESRICIKHNKEACYPRFCNTSNTWRMTCTCQGNLCNGEKDDRVVEAFAKLAKHNVSITTTTKAPTTTVPISTVAFKLANVTVAGAEHEFHNAHEMSSSWSTSSESEMAERLPVAAALQGGESGGGGGEDDEDAGEGSGAALRSDSPRPIDTERTTQLSRHRSTETPQSQEVQGSAAAIKAARVASITAIAIYVLT